MKKTAPETPLIQVNALPNYVRDTGAVLLEMSHAMLRSKTQPFRLENLGHPTNYSQPLHIIEDLSDADATVPFTAADPARVAQRLFELGANLKKPLICMTRSQPFWASRLWWQCRRAGFGLTLVLDGNLKQLAGKSLAHFDLATGPSSGNQSAPLPDDAVLATKVEVLNAIGASDTVLLNTLPYRKFTGDSSTHLARRGRIPGSKNLPSEFLHDSNGRMVSLNKIRELLRGSGVDPMGSQKVIAYCGGGLAASYACLALEGIGHRNWALYDGSLDEWSRDPLLPMETGPDT